MHNAQRKRKRNLDKQEKQPTAPSQNLAMGPIKLKFPSNPGGPSKPSSTTNETSGTAMSLDQGLLDDIDVEGLLSEYKMDEGWASLPSIPAITTSNQQIAFCEGLSVPSAPFLPASNGVSLLLPASLPPVVRLPEHLPNTMQTMNRPIYTVPSQLFFAGPGVTLAYQGMGSREHGMMPVPQTASVDRASLHNASYNLFNLPPSELPLDITEALKTSLEVQVRPMGIIAK